MLGSRECDQHGYYDSTFESTPSENVVSDFQDPVVVVGMGCRLPGGVSNPSELWDLLRAKKTGHRDVSDRFNLNGFYHPNSQRPGSIHTQKACLLDEDPRLFDHAFFGMNSTEVMTMDPTQRKMIEVTYEAFENAGEPWDIFSGSRTGAFIGNFNSDHNVMQGRDADFPLPYSSTGGSTSILSNRINYLFNLRGPSMTIDTACSSSMYALHLAVNSIRSGDCDSAIVGGSNLILAPETQLLMVKLGALSPTSTCHTFDSSADGYARGEGFGALYLKRYSDAVAGEYPIRAVIRGTAVNSNGRTAGITHPSVDGQEAVIRQAYKNAGLSTSLTGYFECHGTGTPVGDPIEVSAIGKIFGRDHGDSPLLVGSIKTNLGHTESASGIVGVMKAILSLEKGMIPPTVGVNNLNPSINFDAARVKVVTEMTPWPTDRLRRVSVNSFGYGGANGHCILDHVSVLTTEDTMATSTARPDNLSRNMSDEAIDVSATRSPSPFSGEFTTAKLTSSKSKTRRMILLPFSAHNEISLKGNISAIREVLPRCALSDLAYTLSKRRSKFLYKTFCLAESACPELALNVDEMMISIKSQNAQSPRIGFIFTGQGAQWPRMGSQLFEYSTFRRSIAYQDKILASLSFAPSWSIKSILLEGSDVSINAPEVSQTVCTALQIALVDLLCSWNINPELTIGHSSGEIAAAYSAGYLSAAEAIIVAYCRGKVVATNSREGQMLAVGLGAESIPSFLSGIEPYIKIAAINSPGSVTLSGDVNHINELYQRLKEDGIFVRLLQTGGNAYHSHHMAALGETYVTLLEQAICELDQDSDNIVRNPLIQWISSVTPDSTMKENFAKAQYFRKNLESPVRFSEAVETMFQSDTPYPEILIEIGPHGALQSPLKQIFAKAGSESGTKSPMYFSALRRQEDGMRCLLNLCGTLFCLNAPLDLAVVNSVEEFENENSIPHCVHGSICVDLPRYRYTYGSPIYYENRISREFKQRKNLRHDILGSLQPGCVKGRPMWRNMLRTKDVPWLKDHNLIPHPVFPASGYVCMAIEAASQFIGASGTERENISFKLRNISIKSAMRLTEDDLGLEVMLNMQALAYSAKWLEFKVCSVTQGDDTWTEHCSGLIMASRSIMTPKTLSNHLDPRVIDVNDWQRKFTEIGLGYGKSFQGLSEILADPAKMLVTAKVSLNTTSGLFKGPESSYLIHPASLDLCHQLALIACHGGQTDRVKHAFVPVFIDEMHVWGDVASEEWALGISVGELKGLRGAYANVQLFGQSGAPRLQITNLRCVSYDGGDIKTNRNRVLSPYARLVWKPDISTLRSDQARKLFPPTVPLASVEESFEKMDKIAMYMVLELSQTYDSFPPQKSYLVRFLDWVRRCAAKKLPYSEEGRAMSSENRRSAIDKLCLGMQDVIEVKLTKRIFDNISHILNDTKTGLEVALQDNLLTELYVSGLGMKAAYPQLERLLDLACHQNPQMKILEIGGGTGGATRVAMHILGAEADSKRYGDYIFTDVSSAFFQNAQTEFSRCKSVSYKTLDINRCPLEQGFNQEFDLVIASECLHATKNMLETFKNVHKLLKPNSGKMILLETARPLLGHGLILGTLPDYWDDIDEDNDSPFSSIEQWRQCLKVAGFSGIDVVLDDYDAPYTIVSTILTTAVALPMIPLPRDTVYIVYYKYHKFHEILSSELHKQGMFPIIASLKNCQVPNKCRAIITANLESDILIDGEEHVFEQLKELVRRASSIIWITNSGFIQGQNPKAAIVSGLVRTISTENPLSRHAVIDLELGIDQLGRLAAQTIVQSESRLQEDDSEREFSMRGGVLNVSRLVPDLELNDRHQLLYGSTTTNKMQIQKLGPVEVQFENPGILSSLYFKNDDSYLKPLNDNWIEVKTAAIGLNWKDLAVSAGRIDLNNFSSECSGIITNCGSLVQGLKPGDRVYGIAKGKFGNYIRFPASFAQKMAPTDNFADMASIPIVYGTAVYAFNHLARLRKGERVLIQSATGGLGLAAIQVAQSIGAEVYATVGTDKKVEYLHELYDIPREYIFSSREIADIPKLMAATADKGFNVILSSSSSDMMHETWRCIAPRGRFIDVGRVDVQEHNTIGMEVFRRNATFSSFDLGILADQDPEFCAELMQEVNDMIRNRSIKPISPIKIFDVSEIEQALLYFSKGKHIGKVVVNYENRFAQIKVSHSISAPRATFDYKAEYILVGGLGGLGRSILQWMADRGAKHLTVLSRSSTRSPEVIALADSLASQDVQLKFISCDITIREQVDDAIRAVSSGNRSIRGILHAAMVLEDKLFDTLSHSQWKLGLSAKVQGTMNLHEATLNHKLDFFIMTSSIETVLALPTQAAYCAANSFQDAFARYRRRQGLPARAIAFGLITEIGEIGQRAITRNSMFRNGCYATGELEFLRLLEAAFLKDASDGKDTWLHHDPLAEPHILTCLDPIKLADMAVQIDANVSAPPPRWHHDKKFSHILQAMQDHLSSSNSGPQQAKTATSSITDLVDALIKAGNFEEASNKVTEAIIQRVAELLFISSENVEGSKSVATYGVDSLIAVELRNWFIVMFESSISLLNLLDERTNIKELAERITKERKDKLAVS